MHCLLYLYFLILSLCLRWYSHIFISPRLLQATVHLNYDKTNVPWVNVLLESLVNFIDSCCLICSLVFFKYA